MISFNATAQKEVRIGKQVWMAKNLNVERFRNGDPIPQAQSADEWREAGFNEKPAWCYYGGERGNGKVYGKLYNMYAISDPRGLAPQGWHLPENSEWMELIDYLGGLDSAGIRMKNNTGWDNKGNGSNASGFSALPGGWRDVGFGGSKGTEGTWWSATEVAAGVFSYYCLWDSSAGIIEKSTAWIHGFAVRCLKNETY